MSQYTALEVSVQLFVGKTVILATLTVERLESVCPEIDWGAGTASGKARVVTLRGNAENTAIAVMARALSMLSSCCEAWNVISDSAFSHRSHGIKKWED